MNPLDAYFINQSHNPGKLTFVNASFWEKRTAIHKPRRPFNFDLKTYPSRTILREVSRVSSLILRAKPWLAKKVLRHGNRFAARVRRRYFSEGERWPPEIRLLFAGYFPAFLFWFLLWFGCILEFSFLARRRRFTRINVWLLWLFCATIIPTPLFRFCCCFFGSGHALFSWNLGWPRPFFPGSKMVQRDAFLL